MHHHTSGERLCRRGLRGGVSVLAVTAMLLAGCAPGVMSTKESIIGPDDGTDPCRPQLVTLANTGDFFGNEILTGAAVGAAGGALLGALATGKWQGALIGAVVGGAAGGTAGYLNGLQRKQLTQAQLIAQVQGDLGTENSRIDATQIAFDQLMACRFQQAEVIRTVYASGQMSRPDALRKMADLKQRAGKDIDVARLIDKQIKGRTEQFDVAADYVSPGTTAEVAGSKPPPQQARVRRAVPVKVVPSEGAPQVAQLKPRESVTVTGSRGDYAVVETSDGKQGYVAASDLAPAGKTMAPWVDPRSGPATTGDVRSLAGSNAARRDAFEQSVSVTEHASASGFELAG